MLLFGIILILSEMTFAQDPFELHCNRTDQKMICYNEIDAPVILHPAIFTPNTTTVESLIIQVKPTSSFRVVRTQTFQEFKALQHLEIRVNTVLFDSDITEHMRETLFNVESLKTLIIDGADFTSDGSNWHSWQLPTGLNELTIVNCQYTEFDLTGCPNLQYVDFSNNLLTKIPTFVECLPKLETLILVNNPLLVFSVNDIARLYGLKQLRLGYYSMGSRHRRCECQRLQEWCTKNIANSTLELKCNLKAATTDCKEYTLDEANKIRVVHEQKCKNVRTDF